MKAPKQILVREEDLHDADPAESAEIATLHVQDWEQTLQDLSTPNIKLTIPRDPTLRRKQVVSAFHDAFELIGGVPRLALWADQNQTEFYRLYAKLMPKTNENTSTSSSDITIKHVLPRSKLDED